MNATDVIGYAYEADLHCEDCARERFPEANPDFSNVEDAEGNPIHPLFAGDEHPEEGEYCGDCGAELWEPVPPTFSLGDDGTLDTVIVCNRCGEEQRFNFDGDGEEEYDDFIAWCFEVAADEHECRRGGSHE